jgi:hypothetical protein
MHDETDRKLRPEEQDPRLWRGDGWTARVVKNTDDDGWAVEMIRDGHDEPSLVGPWTMGRDKKSPKPLDAPAFATLLKGANEILARHEQQRRAQLHRSATATTADGERRRVDLDVVPDEDDPHAIVTVWDDDGQELSRSRVAPTFQLTAKRAQRWIDEGPSEGS